MKLKTMFILGRLLLVLYLLLLITVYAGQYFIIFQPESLTANFAYEFDGLFEDGFLTINEDNQINYLHFKSQNESRGVVLYFHGNSDNLKRWGNYHKDFTERGYDLFMIDYRGYGKSTGKLSEQHMYEEAQVAYDHVLQKYQPENITIYGRSLGAGVASDLASKVPAQQLILETPFNSIRSLFLDRVIILWLPFKLKYRFENNKRIEEIKYPVTIIHGTSDGVVPYQNAARLKSSLKNSDKFVTIEGGGHKNLTTFDSFQQTLDELLSLKQLNNTPTTIKKTELISQ